MAFRQAESVVSHIQTEADEGAGVYVGIVGDDLGGDPLDVDEDVEEEAPENESDGEFQAEGHLEDDLDVVLEIVAEGEHAAPLAEPIDHVVLHGGQEVEPGEEVALHGQVQDVGHQRVHQHHRPHVHARQVQEGPQSDVEQRVGVGVGVVQADGVLLGEKVVMALGDFLAEAQLTHVSLIYNTTI